MNSSTARLMIFCSRRVRVVSVAEVDPVVLEAEDGWIEHARPDVGELLRRRPDLLELMNTLSCNAETFD